MNDIQVSLPLNGMRIIDLSRVLAGPLCAMMLADLGADVLKVERPGTGDDTRGWGPPFAPNGQSTYFQSANGNKASLALDLANADDRALLRSLLADADVVLENFLPGTLARLGLDVNSLLSEHPTLIWCSIGGFESTPARPGYDAVMQAETGWMSITGTPAGEPVKVGVAVTDVLTAKDAATAILAALWARERRGSSGGSDPSARRLTVSLQRSALAGLVNVAQAALVTGAAPDRWGNAHASLVPYELFDTADRPLVLAVGSDAQWRHCARVLALTDPRVDRGWLTNAGRVADREVLVPLIRARMGTRLAAEWLAEFAAAGVPAGLVKTVPEALGAFGALAAGGAPSAVGGRRRLPPPALDEHGALVRQLGWQAFRVMATASGGGSSVTT